MRNTCFTCDDSCLTIWGNDALLDIACCLLLTSQYLTSCEINCAPVVHILFVEALLGLASPAWHTEACEIPRYQQCRRHCLNTVQGPCSLYCLRLTIVTSDNFFNFVFFAITPSNGVPSVPLNQVLGLQWPQCVAQHLHPAFATFPLYAVLLVIARSISFGAQGVVHSPSGSDLGSVSGCFANFTICGWLAISVLCLRRTHKCTDSVHALFVVSYCLASEQQTLTFLF